MKRIRFIGLLLLLPALVQAANLQNPDSTQQLLDTTHGKAKIKLLIKLSEQNRNKSAYGCKQYFQQAFSLAKTNNYKDLMGLSSKTMGVSYFYWGDMQNAHKYFREGLYYYRQSDNKEGQSNCLNDIGLVYEGWADFDSAAFYYKASYLIEKELGNVEGEATSLINMGNIDYYRKAYPSALVDYFKALKKFIQSDNQNGIAMAYNSLAIIYTQIGDFNKALKYLDKARNIYSVTGNVRKLSRTLNNMADIYSGHLKEYRKAEILYNKTLGIKEGLSDKEGIALVKCNLGVMYGQMGNLSLSLKYFNESLLIYHQTGDKTGISMVHQNKAKALQAAGMFRKALNEFHKSLAISTKTGLKSFTINNYLGIFKCYAALGEYNNFNKYFNLFEKSRDTITQHLEKERIAGLEAQYKIDTLLRQKESLKEESRRKEIKIRHYIILSISLSLIVIFLIIALILYKRAKKYEVKE